MVLIEGAQGINCTTRAMKPSDVSTTHMLTTRSQLWRGASMSSRVSCLTWQGLQGMQFNATPAEATPCEFASLCINSCTDCVLRKLGMQLEWKTYKIGLQPVYTSTI